MRFRDLHPNIRLRIIVSFFVSMVNNMILPFMAIYFAAHFGEKLTGVMMALILITKIIAGFYGGYFADRLGRKKVMTVAQFFVVIGGAILSFANSPWLDSAILTFLMMVLISFCSGLSNPAAQAMIIDVSTPENRKFIYSLSYWTNNGSMALGGVIGGFLFKAHRFELFLAVMVLELISFLVLIFFISETHQPNLDAKDKAASKYGLGEIIANYSVVAKDKVFLIFSMATLLALSIEMQARNYVGVRLANEMPTQSLLHFGSWHFTVDGIKLFGIMNAENSILVVATGMLVSSFMKRYQDKKVLFAGILINGLGFAIIGISNQPWVILITMAVVTISELMYWPVTQAILAEIPPEGNRSSYMAINSLVGSGAVMIGSFSITLGGFFPSWVLGLIFFATGLVSVAMFSNLLPKLGSDKPAVQTGSTVNG